MASKNEQKIQEIVDAMAVPGIISTGAGNKITGNQIASRISSIPRRTGFKVNNTQYRLNIKAEAGYYPSDITYPIDIFTGSTNVTPAANNIILSTSHKYLNGNVTVRGDPNLIPSNIKAGTYIFGVYGTYGGSSITSMRGTFRSTSPNFIFSATNYNQQMNQIDCVNMSNETLTHDIVLNSFVVFTNLTGTAPPYYDNGLILLNTSSQTAPRMFYFKVVSNFIIEA